jgi:hypothetical protein
VEREAAQGKYDIKTMQAEVESLRRKADATGWGQKRSRQARRRCAEQRPFRCAVHRYVFTLSFTRRSLVNHSMAVEKRDVVRSRVCQLDFNYTPSRGMSRASPGRFSSSGPRRTGKARRSRSRQVASYRTSS